MKQTLLTKILNRILVLLGFTGATSCIFAAMYGSPYMDFEVSGKVVDQEAAPIAGIQVSTGSRNTLTAEDGSFSIAGSDIYAMLDFEDIDGPENGGEFAGMSQKIEVNRVKKGKGKWYMGRYEAKDVVIEMKKK